MKDIRRLRRTFIRQREQADCGIACLAMIFNYCGRHLDATPIFRIPIPKDGLSLANLQSISAEFGFSTRAVEMDMAYLATLTVPCILHIVTEQQELHYIICYGSRENKKSREYLIADPARHFTYIDENKLSEQWQTRTALYFESLTPDLTAFRQPIWLKLWQYKNFPGALLLAIPFLTFFGALIGVTSSWLLQKGLNDNSILQGRIIVCILILLSILTFSRCLIIYLRQRILVNINTAIHAHLMWYLLERTFAQTPVASPNLSSFNLKQALSDIQRISNAASAFIAGLCSDGLLICILLAAIFFYLPLAGFINLIFLALSILMIGRYTISFRYANQNLARLAANVEQTLAQDITKIANINSSALLGNLKSYHHQKHLLSLKHSQTVFTKTTKSTLWLETVGVINTISIFIICVNSEQNGGISYAEFMIIIILSYLISSFIPKLANSTLVVSDGAEAALQFSYTVGNSI